jgi:hypothetical protein
VRYLENLPVQHLQIAAAVAPLGLPHLPAELQTADVHPAVLGLLPALATAGLAAPAAVGLDSYRVLGLFPSEVGLGTHKVPLGVWPQLLGRPASIAVRPFELKGLEIVFALFPGLPVDYPRERNALLPQGLDAFLVLLD